MNDFNGEDYDFAAGAVYGMRSWGMDEMGRLHGVSHTAVWTPGENVSTCNQTRQIPCPNPVAPRDHLPAGTVVTYTPSSSKKKGKKRRFEPVMAPWERELLDGTVSGLRARCGDATCYQGVHTVASDHTFDPDCACGFWAYDDHTFTEHGDVSGIIQGYGRTTIGTRGFRSEKAKIVALCRRNLSYSAWMRLQHLYPGAAFYENRDQMIRDHGAVMHTWPDIGDGFWEQPVPKPEELSFATYFTHAARSLSRSQSSFYSSFWGQRP